MKEKSETRGAKKAHHSFQIRFFFKPILCSHCSDYIWGEGYLGYGCVKCGICTHAKCKLFIMSPSPRCDENQHNKASQLDANTKSTYFAISDWPVNIVKEWLAVVNLHRYAEVFSSYNINGAKLLNLDIYQLYAFRIRDSYHHAAILQARDELSYRLRHFCNAEKMLSEIDQAKSNLLCNPYKLDNHHFLVHTNSRLTDCDVCRRPLLGIVHQCLNCQRCGIMVHRQCAALGLPKCHRINIDHQRLFKSHYIFGVSLFDLAKTNHGEIQTPPILTKCFREIEDRALATGEDLYDVYRLSADTSKIEECKQMLNQTGCELIQLSNYDLNTLAAVVKTFLRDLQNSVIPEEMYEMLVSRIQTLSSDDLRSLVAENLPPVHYACLRQIMAHLIRVWCYQFKVRGCHYLPDKLFHIFRSILMRPPWENITQIVYNIDNQTLVIQRLMLECDWGKDVELPEHKIRPKRPINPSSISLDNIHQKEEMNEEISTTSKRLNSLVKHVSTSSTNSLSLSGLNECQWYWSDLSRDDTILVLNNCPDGSFLVRNSSDRAQNAPYTLCVMRGAFVKSIKIFKQEQQTSGVFYYDIEKPCRFDSVQTLIAYYSRVSLNEYNHNLDVVLTYGVSKYKFGKTNEWSLDKLYASFRDAYHEFQQMTKKYDGLESEIGYVREDMSQKKTAVFALETIINMYTAQIQQIDKVLNEMLLKKNQAISSVRLLAASLMPVRPLNDNSQATQHDDDIEQTQRSMNSNREKLKQRVDDLIKKRDEIRVDMEYLNKVLAQLQEELDMLRPELIELRKKRENYHMWLLQRGENDDKIQKKLKEVMKMNIESEEKNIELLPYDKTSKTAAKTSLKSSSSMQNLENLGAITEEIAHKETVSTTNQEAYKNNAEKSIYETNPHANSLNWYLAECDRDKATMLLSNQNDGTYLIRPNLKQVSPKYVLSFVHQGEIKHILIEEDSSGCFVTSKSSLMGNKMSRSSLPGGEKDEKTVRNRSSSNSYSTISSLISSISTQSDKTKDSDYLDVNQEDKSSNHLKFKTLTELVCYYSRNPIVIENTNLNSILLHPVNLTDQMTTQF